MVKRYIIKAKLEMIVWKFFYRKRYSSIAQLVEHAAVNRRVVGSSPT